MRYVYDGRLVVQERDANNLALVTYTRGNDLSGAMQEAGGIGGLLARTDNGLLIAGSASAHAYYHADGNGNVTALVNSNQLLVAKYAYDPYGTALSASGPLAEANLYRFSSKEWHPNSGLAYYLYRYYEPNLHQWLNRDPLGELGSELLHQQVKACDSLGRFGDFNMHRFVGNNPPMNLDHYGLSIASIVDALIPDYVACVGRCVEQKDPVNKLADIADNQLESWLLRPAHIGTPIPYTPLRKLGWPQKLGTRLTNLLSMAHEAGLGGRWLRYTGRVLSPVNTLYGWWMVGKEVECAAECAGDPKAY